MFKISKTRETFQIRETVIDQVNSSPFEKRILLVHAWQNYRRTYVRTMSRARCLLVSSSPLPRSRNLNRGDRVFCKILQDGSTRLAAERHLFTSWRIVLTRRQSPRSYRARCFYRVRATTTNLRWLVRQTLPPLPCCKNHFPFQSIVMAVSIGHGTLDTNVPPSFRADLIPLRIS